MTPILVGLETEYGFSVEDGSTQEQVDNATEFVRCCPVDGFVGWDYRHESPRADLRGFQVGTLKTDPRDEAFDAGRPRKDDADVRADRILATGARFYNDHGHPEYATPECLSLAELAMQEAVGDHVMRLTAAAYVSAKGNNAKVYKNNSDGKGASYGSHESYLVPRSLGFDGVFRTVLPVLVARQVLCGSGKVGVEAGQHSDFQISQRADFMTEAASVDTLFSRPVFNTRDEPHADLTQWMRLHVICGDSNRIPFATKVRFAIVKIAVWLAESGRSPNWRLADPATSFRTVSRDLNGAGRIGLEGANWTEPRAILESYVEAGERFLDTSAGAVCESLTVASEALSLFDGPRSDDDKFCMAVDWAAKLRMLRTYLDTEGTDWGDPFLKSLDLSYHDLDSDESLYDSLVEFGIAGPPVGKDDVNLRLRRPVEPTRALARSVAVTNHRENLINASWGSMTFRTQSGLRNVDLLPDVVYPRGIEQATDLDEFLSLLELKP